MKIFVLCCCVRNLYSLSNGQHIPSARNGIEKENQQLWTNRYFQKWRKTSPFPPLNSSSGWHLFIFTHQHHQITWWYVTEKSPNSFIVKATHQMEWNVENCSNLLLSECLFGSLFSPFCLLFSQSDMNSVIYNTSFRPMHWIPLSRSKMWKTTSIYVKLVLVCINTN